MSLKNLADKLYPAFIENFKNNSVPLCRIFLSASDMKVRAFVKNSSANSLEVAWNIALEELEKILKSEKIVPKILRADWVISSEKITWKNFNKLVEKTRRNYFRKGLALDSDYKIAFTEMEMNGNSMLYLGGKEGGANGVFRKKFSDLYCQRRFGCDFPTPAPTDTVEIFETQGAFVEENEEPKNIKGKNIYAGYREVSPIDPELFMRLAKSGANYLARQVQKSGKFIYGVHSFFNKTISTYNALRHMSSAFAMLDVYGAYKKLPPIKLGKAITSAIEYGVKNFIVRRKLDDGKIAAYLADPVSKEIKLGANGVSLLAFVKYSELMHTKKYLPLMKELANGILSMQKNDGSFVHVLNTSDFSVKEPFRIVYYDGEAVFGMLRLYSITKDENLMQASELAFQRFIATNHWKNHDHWLSYAINELTSYKPEAKYFEFGINNFLSFLPFIYHRDTQFPTLMELMMAADTMLERMKTMPEMSELLARVNLNDFYASLEKRAENLLNGFFWPELAMYFESPERIVGSFFIRHHAFRVRIDDVEHYLSGFVAYCRYLERRKNLPSPVPSQELLNGKAEGTGIVNVQASDIKVAEEKKSLPEEKVLPAEEKKSLPEEKVLPAEEKKSLPEEKVLPAEEKKSLPEEKKIPKPTNIISVEDFEVNLDDFKKNFDLKNGKVFFMLSNIKKNAAGLELSSFHRAKIFKKYLGINVCFVTNEYQTDIPKNLEHYGLENNFLNLYDYFQEIDRKNFVAPSVQILSVTHHEENYIDSYDPLGFLGRRQKINPETKNPTEIIYYRPDGTEALREFYNFVDNKNILNSVEIVDKDKNIVQKFSSHEKFISYWLSLIFNDKEKNYFIISDRPAEYARTYMDIKASGLENIHVFHQLHSIHFKEVQDDSKTKIITRYRVLTNNKLKADGIVVCTERQKEDIVQRYNLNNVFVIPHALKNFSPSHVVTDPFKIIFVGRLVKGKGPNKVLEAFKIVSQAVPQAHLHFCGKGPLQKRIQEKINSYGLQDKVFFEGFVTNILDAYSSAALSVCASDVEGFSMAIQESLQMSCPVVSFDCPYGPGDMISDGENGFLVPLGDIETMAQKIILILQNPELRQKLSGNATKSIQKYSQPVVAKKWADLFSKILDAKKSGGAEKTATIFFGGDVNLGRRMHFRINEVEQFSNMEEMKKADLRIVNLECVLSGKGAQGVDKGEGGPYYFHARPEQIKILTEAEFDIVLTANNHTGDYGKEALLDEEKYLDAAGILHTGSGKNFSEAIKPVYKNIRGLNVAVFSVDATMPPFASDENNPGTAFISLKRPEIWEKVFKTEIQKAREKADIVIVAPHWGINNTTKNSAEMKNIGHLLIDSGADAVLGCHSHMIHGVENYKERPIIYDAGDFLFDAATRGKGGGCFTLEISSDGVKKVNFIPLFVGYGFTYETNGTQAEEISKDFIELCKEFNTNTILTDKNIVEVKFNPPKRERNIFKPIYEPSKEWTVEEIPEDAKIDPQNLGPVKLLGCKVSPLSMQRRQMLFVETYWAVDEPTEKNCKFDIVGITDSSTSVPNFGGGMQHEGCDWMWPTNRWKPGIIYYERFGLRPPERKKLASCSIRVEIRVRTSKTEIFGPYVDKNIAELKLANN